MLLGRSTIPSGRQAANMPGICVAFVAAPLRVRLKTPLQISVICCAADAYPPQLRRRI